MAPPPLLLPCVPSTKPPGKEEEESLTGASEAVCLSAPCSPTELSVIVGDYNQVMSN